MSRNSILLVLMAIASLWACGRLHEPLLELRRAGGLNQGEPLENAPPLVAFTTVAFGAFRGLAADILWMRASELQDRGQYFELVQLADWITKLQPRFASIWAFHGWNLAYNVSVMLPDPNDRWRWVRHGISLLRDQGMTYNPGSALLHRELAWIFYHKIGMDLDQAHLLYKREWALEMTRLLGGARPQPDLPTLARLADQPAADRLAEPAIAQFTAELARHGIDAFAEEEPALHQIPEPLRARWTDSAEGRALRAVARVQRMLTRYRLDPRQMLQIEQQLGVPLDWRGPYAHALYWAATGLTHARTRFDDVALRRQIFQAMNSTFLRGRISFSPDGRTVMLAPEPDVLPAVRASFDEALARHPDDPTVRQAHRNFLVDGVMICTAYQRTGVARELFAELQRRHGEATNVTFERFVADTWTGHLRDLDTDQALAAVEAALYQAALWRLLGDPIAAAGHEEIAALCWRAYMADRQDPELRERTGLPPIEQIRARAEERLRADLGARDARAP
ncbi:MAG: hypothetical protein N2652_03825 [Kiritimatiellae bacterium]|nr:hypothetical protein [Kiritimatiellia bacterium]